MNWGTWFYTSWPQVTNYVYINFLNFTFNNVQFGRERFSAEEVKQGKKARFKIFIITYEYVDQKFLKNVCY